MSECLVEISEFRVHKSCRSVSRNWIFLVYSWGCYVCMYAYCQHITVAGSVTLDVASFGETHTTAVAITTTTTTTTVVNVTSSTDRIITSPWACHYITFPYRSHTYNYIQKVHIHKDLEFYWWRSSLEWEVTSFYHFFPPFCTRNSSKLKFERNHENNSLLRSRINRIYLYQNLY